MTARLTNSSDSARCTASSVATNGGSTVVRPSLRLTSVVASWPAVAFRLVPTAAAAGRYDTACAAWPRAAAWSAFTWLRASGKLHSACSGWVGW